MSSHPAAAVRRVVECSDPDQAAAPRTSQSADLTLPSDVSFAAPVGRGRGGRGRGGGGFGEAIRHRSTGDMARDLQSTWVEKVQRFVTQRWVPADTCSRQAVHPTTLESTRTDIHPHTHCHRPHARTRTRTRKVPAGVHALTRALHRGNGTLRRILSVSKILSCWITLPLRMRSWTICKYGIKLT